jgi:hypothetical protein
VDLAGLFAPPLDILARNLTEMTLSFTTPLAAAQRMQWPHDSENAVHTTATNGSGGNIVTIQPLDIRSFASTV